jgi:hypothetical protein
MTARVLPLPLPPSESHNESEDDEDDEDDLVAILAQIRELEELESERLATQLQHEWIGDHEQVALDEALAKTFEEEQAWHIEEDMLLAKKLAEVWEEEDRLALLHPSSSTSGGFKSAELVNLDRFDNDEEFPRPDITLLDHRSLFTSSRPCPTCTKSILSPLNPRVRLALSLRFKFHVYSSPFFSFPSVGSFPHHLPHHQIFSHFSMPLANHATSIGAEDVFVSSLVPYLAAKEVSLLRPRHLVTCSIVVARFARSPSSKCSLFWIERSSKRGWTRRNGRSSWS